MRGAFNRLCDLFYGPESPFGPPNTQYAASLPCRFVPQPLIDQDDFPLALADAWMTIEAVPPNTPKILSSSLGEWHARIYTADQVAISGVAGGPWYAIRLEEMTGPDQAPYYRVMLLPVSRVVYPDWLPPGPPPPPTPGATCATAATLALNVPVVQAIAPGATHWWQIPVAGGLAHRARITATTDPTLSTFVQTGTCAGLTPVAPPFAGVGQVAFTPMMATTAFFTITTAMGGSYTVEMSQP